MASKVVTQTRHIIRPMKWKTMVCYQLHMQITKTKARTRILQTCLLVDDHILVLPIGLVRGGKVKQFLGTSKTGEKKKTE